MIGRRRRRRKRDPSRPLRVVQVCGTTDGGLWMVQICVGLQRRGFDVAAIIGSPDGGTAAALRKVGVPFVAMEQPIRSSSRAAALLGAVPRIGVLRGVIDVAGVLRTAYRMSRVLRRMEADVVHSHLFSSMLLARFAAAMARVPIRVSMIAGPMHLESGTGRRFDIATHRLDDRILAGCRHTDDLYAEFGVPAHRRSVVPYGIDPHGYDPARADGARVRREFGISEDTPLVGQVAFFYPVLGPVAAPGNAGRGIKGHEDLMAAARIVLDDRPDVRFLVVGDGFGEGGRRHFDAIRLLAYDLGIGHAVIFPGRRRDLPDVYAALDVSVQCSISENYGGTIESLLMARPTVATRAGGMTETVIDGETGLQVPVADPQALAAAILRLIEDPALARRLGEAGRARMLRDHTIQQTIDGVVRVYGELAERKGIKAPPLDSAQPPWTTGPLEGLGLMPRDVLFTETP